MKGLSLIEPWASLMVLGHKLIETRKWAPRQYKGAVAIHASLSKECTKPAYVADLCARAGLGPIFAPDYAWPYGKIVAAGELVSCVRTEEINVLTPQERALGDYTPGRRAWGFRDFWRLPEPIHCRGARSLWDVPPEVEAEITAQKARLAAVAAPQNGNGHAVPPLLFEPSPPADILDRAKQWAAENGLRGDLTADWATVRYPIEGHGFVVTLRERTGEQRIATARFDQAGNPQMWTLDGTGGKA